MRTFFFSKFICTNIRMRPIIASIWGNDMEPIDRLTKGGQIHSSGYFCIQKAPCPLQGAWYVSNAYALQNNAIIVASTSSTWKEYHVFGKFLYQDCIKKVLKMYQYFFLCFSTTYFKKSNSKLTLTKYVE